MLFEGRRLHEISEAEIGAFVRESRGERIDVEFKARYELRNDKDRIEILSDIASFANARGGFILVGINDDGHGRAAGWSKQDVEALRKCESSLRQSTHEFIRERIPDLEFSVRSIDGNGVLIIRVPESDRKPHMVSYGHLTKFCMRYDDGKREMTLEEIRDAIINRESERISVILAERIVVPAPGPTFAERVARATAEEPYRERDYEVLKEAVLQRAERLSSPPEIVFIHLPRDPSAIRFKSDSALGTLGSRMRESGWTFHRALREVRPTLYGYEFGSQYSRVTVQILENGVIIGKVPIDASITRPPLGGPRPEHTDLYPYAVVEYALSFCFLVRNLYDVLPNQNRGGEIIMMYRGIKGFRLRPYRPGIVGYDLAHLIPSFPETNFSTYITIGTDFDANEAAFELIRRFYRSFGHKDDVIPFWDSENRQFVLAES
jgi:hypothetical protein